MSHARFVLTDSGGIQEETTILGIPCITIRNNTERPITLSEGTNILAGTNKDAIVRESLHFINSSPQEFPQPNLWDGKASERIIKIIINKTLASDC
jgi:UDP-N-acetylglucosamine 2-epimerase (non-hydrolysing)